MPLLDTRHLDQSIDTLEIGDKSTFEKQDGNLNNYSLAKPHPGFGKDPNIKNELGHTEYPKWIDSKRTGNRIVVNSPMEEAQHLSDNPPSVPQVPEPVKQEPAKTEAPATPATNPWA